MQSQRRAVRVPAQHQPVDVQPVRPAAQLRALAPRVGVEDLLASAGVDGAQHLDRLLDLGLAERELLLLELGAIERRIRGGNRILLEDVELQVSGLDEAYRAHDAVRVDDNGAGPAAVAVLDGRDDDAAARQLAAVLRVAVARAGGAVREHDEREGAVAVLAQLHLHLLAFGRIQLGEIALLRREQRRIDVGRNAVASGGGPQCEGYNAFDQSAPHLQKARIALGLETDGS